MNAHRRKIQPSRCQSDLHEREICSNGVNTDSTIPLSVSVGDAPEEEDEKEEYETGAARDGDDDSGVAGELVHGENEVLLATAASKSGRGDGK